MLQASIVLYPQALASSVSLPLEALTAADQFQRTHQSRKPSINCEITATNKQSITCSGGLTIKPHRQINRIKQSDLIILPALWRNPMRVINRQMPLLEWLIKMHKQGSTLCAVGTGSYFLAEAGLLNNKAATTHWYYFDDFQQRYPKVQLQRRHLITQAGSIYCAGSVNSIVDLMVHFILNFFGQTTAQQVETHFSPEIRQSYDTHLYSDHRPLPHHDEDIVRAQHWLKNHYEQSVSMQTLAGEIGLSTRSLNRRFKAATGQSPLHYLQNLRMDIAKELLRDSNLSIAEIAYKIGYSDCSHFSKLFQRQMSQTPLTYRQRVRGKLFDVQ